MSTLAATNLKNASSGSNNVVLNADGTTTITSPSNLIKSGTVNAGGTTPFPVSGGPVAVDFTGIPSWVKRITVMFNGVSTSGTSNIMLQLGSGGSFLATGYLGTVSNQAGSAQVAHNTGFVVTVSNAAADIFHGTFVANLLSANTWCEQSMLGASNTNAVRYSGGSVTLSGTLDRVRITTVSPSTDTFDAGSINILWEG